MGKAKPVKKSRKKGYNLSQKAADDVYCKTKLIDVKLIAATANNNGATRQNLPKHTTIEAMFKTTLQGVDSRPAVSHRIVVEIQVDVGARFTETDRDAALAVMSRFKLYYDLPDVDGLDEDRLASFGIFSCAKDAWPYVAEYIHSTCNRMGLPALRVPPFNQHDKAEIIADS